jgi:uncharacterized protein (DUF2062 family)
MHKKKKDSFINKVAAYIVELFTQGLTQEKIALSIAMGICAGSFPVLGLATPMCALLAIVFKLNMGIVQLVNYVAAPLHFMLIPTFLWVGSFLPWNEPLVFDMPALKAMLPHTWVGFLKLLGSYLSGAVVVWLVFMPVATVLLYFVCLLFVKLVLRRKVKSSPNASR